MLRKKKFLIGGIIIFIAVGYLGYHSFTDSATFYYRVSEFVQQGGSVLGENVRVNGQVVPASVERESDGLTMRFTIAESGQSLPVVYKGVVPDTFKAGNEVVVEGRLNSAGVLEANNILTKCPSKYEPEK